MVKVAVVLVGDSVFGTSIVSVATDDFGIWKPIPWSSLSADSDFKTKSESGGAYENKFGSKHAKYFTVIGEQNKDW